MADAIFQEFSGKRVRIITSNGWKYQGLIGALGMNHLGIDDEVSGARIWVAYQAVDVLEPI